MPPRALRRLGRAQRLALGAAQDAIDAWGGSPEPADDAAALVGTGLGCLGETAAFLENLVERDEREPSPTHFIHSVHNAAAAQIALCFGLRGETSTFSHGQISFELALWQALWLIRRGRSRQVVVVGVDELSPYAVAAGQARGWWRRDPAPLEPMAGGGLDGSLPGEGAAGLVLGPPAEGRARVDAVRVEPLLDPRLSRLDPRAEAGFIGDALAAAGRAPDGVDLFLLGANGDRRLDALYGDVARALAAAAPGARCGVFKHRCGEFCTAPAVGVALAARAVGEGRLPPEIRPLPGGEEPPGVSRVAVYHLHEAGYHSVCLVAS
jgi:hypothetical protein